MISGLILLLAQAIFLGQNWTLGTPQASAPTFSPTSPYSGGATTVTISDSTTGNTITYCQNTSSCTPATTYTTGISFTASGQICAFATAPGFTQSSTVCWVGTFSSSPVTFNNVNTIAQVTSSSYSGSMSVTAGGSNLCAFALISYDGHAGGFTDAAITSVTYGGVAMTAAGTAPTPLAQASSQIFYLAAPATGSNTLVVTGNSHVNEIYVNLVSFKNCNQTTPVRAGSYTTAQGTGTSASIAIPSNASDLTVSAIIPENGSMTTTNQTSTGFSFAGAYSAGGDRSTVGASSVTHTWTGGSDTYTVVGVSVSN